MDQQVVVIPYPSRGHINAVLNLCHLLSSHPRFRHENPTTVFTVVVTEEWLGIIGSDPNTCNVRYATIPNVIPLEDSRADTVGFFMAVQTKMEAPFDRLLDGMELPVNYVIMDVMLKWAFNLGKQRKIPVAAYWPKSATLFNVLYHHRVHTDGTEYDPFDIDLQAVSIDDIPGSTPIFVEDLPWPTPDPIFLTIPHHLHRLSRIAKCLLLTTFYELEFKAVDAIENVLEIRVYTIGSNIPHFQLQPQPQSRPAYLSWLDTKPPNSVLYVSLGSLATVSCSQIYEIDVGLKESGVSFLWAARPKAEHIRLIRDFGTKVLVVEWCDQWRVLSDRSVGGFFSHCGWNSVKEGLFLGVPIMSFPISGDQPLNRKLLFEDWNCGYKARMESFVTRETIARKVRNMMDSEFLRHMIQRTNGIQNICRLSIEEGQRAYKNMDGFKDRMDYDRI